MLLSLLTHHCPAVSVQNFQVVTFPRKGLLARTMEKASRPRFHSASFSVTVPPTVSTFTTLYVREKARRGAFEALKFPESTHPVCRGRDDARRGKIENWTNDLQFSGPRTGGPRADEKAPEGGRGVMETKASRGHVGNRLTRVECGGAVRQLESLEIVRRVACFFPTLESILTVFNC